MAITALMRVCMSRSEPDAGAKSIAFSSFGLFAAGFFAAGAFFAGAFVAGAFFAGAFFAIVFLAGGISVATCSLKRAFVGKNRVARAIAL